MVYLQYLFEEKYTRMLWGARVFWKSVGKGQNEKKIDNMFPGYSLC